MRSGRGRGGEGGKRWGKRGTRATGREKASGRVGAVWAMGCADGDDETVGSGSVLVSAQKEPSGRSRAAHGARPPQPRAAAASPPPGHWFSPRPPPHTPRQSRFRRPSVGCRPQRAPDPPMRRVCARQCRGSRGVPHAGPTSNGNCRAAHRLGAAHLPPAATQPATAQGDAPVWVPQMGGGDGPGAARASVGQWRALGEGGGGGQRLMTSRRMAPAPQGPAGCAAMERMVRVSPLGTVEV